MIILNFFVTLWKGLIDSFGFTLVIGLEGENWSDSVKSTPTRPSWPEVQTFKTHTLTEGMSHTYPHNPFAHTRHGGIYKASNSKLIDDRWRGPTRIYEAIFHKQCGTLTHLTRIGWWVGAFTHRCGLKDAWGFYFHGFIAVDLGWKWQLYGSPLIWYQTFLPMPVQW